MATLLLTACGPQLGDLEKGETGRVVRAFNGDTLELDSGLRIFLAEIDAPAGEEPYAASAQAELEALALHRPVQLAYGGTKRWVPRPRPGEPQAEAPSETAIAHVFVQSEGGRWFWLQHELVTRGAAFVRPRQDNHARTEELLAIEKHAREQEAGLWTERAYRPLTARAAAVQALAFNDNCLRGRAPYRIVEGRVIAADIFERRAALKLEGETPFEIVVFGNSFANWGGPALNTLNGARLRVRGPLGVYRDTPQLCLDQSSQLEVLR
ncbi:MAG: thermonuclease family protein [Hyphomonadaceae bacterium]|nr:thermonuclease family protein [Hyphomonadaceae bacterium]